MTAKHNPDEWVISTIAFTDPKGLPLVGMTQWSALGTTENDRKTTVEEGNGHVTLVYEAGDVRLRCDVSKHNCHIVRMPKAKYMELKAKQNGGR